MHLHHYRVFVVCKYLTLQFSINIFNYHGNWIVLSCICLTKRTKRGGLPASICWSLGNTECKFDDTTTKVLWKTRKMSRNSFARAHTTLCFVATAVVTVYWFFFACFFLLFRWCSFYLWTVVFSPCAFESLYTLALAGSLDPVFILFLE